MSSNPKHTKNKYELQQLNSLIKDSVHIKRTEEQTIHERKEHNIALYNSLPDRHNEIKCPSCGSFEYDTQECAECGFSVHTITDFGNKHDLTHDEIMILLN